MKKLLTILIIVISAGAAMAQSKIAHVNSQQLLDTLPSRKAAIVKLQEFEASGIAELQEMQTDLEKAYQRFQAEQSNWSPVIIKIEEEKIVKKQQAFQEREQSLQAEMQAYSNELNGPILKMIQDAVQVVSDRKKLDYVLDVSVALVANGEDITNEVAVELLKMDSAENK